MTEGMTDSDYILNLKKGKPDGALPVLTVYSNTILEERRSGLTAESDRLEAVLRSLHQMRQDREQTVL